MFGQEAGGDPEFQGSLMSHAGDLARTDDAEAIEGGELTSHDSTVAAQTDYQPQLGQVSQSDALDGRRLMIGDPLVLSGDGRA